MGAGPIISGICRLRDMSTLAAVIGSGSHREEVSASEFRVPIIRTIPVSETESREFSACRDTVAGRTGVIDCLFFSPYDVEVVEHTVWKEESGHVFVDIEGSGGFGAGTGSGRVGHNFERFECVDTKIRHSDYEHRIMAFKDLNKVTLP